MIILLFTWFYTFIGAITVNFNSDYQSNQNRLQSSEVVNLSLNTLKTKTKFKTKQKNIVRIFCEILFVFTAVGIGYMQGLKSFSTYSNGNGVSKASIHPLPKTIPENHHEMMLKQK